MTNTSSSESSILRVHWLVSPTHNVPITCSLVSGLSDLRRRREIELEMSLLSGDPGSEHIMRFDVSDAAGGDTRKVGFDVSDRSDSFCITTLESVDFYFKRNYWPASTSSLPDHLRKKVRPAGITFGCYVPNSRTLLIKSALMSFLGRSKSPGKYDVIPSTRRLFSELEQIRCILSESTWERSADDSVVSRIVFQTRVWNNHPERKIDRTDVNNSRISLTRALRESFGFEDTIGLLDTTSAHNLAADAILSRKVTRAEYAQQLRTSLIAVNSHGLDGSCGFKVAESLAAGCAIVSEPLMIQLPVPIEPNVHYLPFNTAQECVAQCRYLLENPDIAEKMRAANLDYYDKQVRPTSLARNLLNRAAVSDVVCGCEELSVNKAAGSLG